MIQSRIEFIPRSTDIYVALYRAKVSLFTEISRTYLSFAWWILDPVLDLIIYYTLFSFVLQRGGSGFVMDLLCGILTMRWFSTATNSAANQLVASLSIMSIIKLPKYIFPLTTVVSGTFKFLIVYMLFMFIIIILGYEPTSAYILLVFLIFIQFIFILGVSFIIAGLTPFFPDLSLMYTKLTMILFWASGVFYKAEDLFTDPNLIFAFYLNPLAIFIKLQRAIFNRGPIEFHYYIYTTVVSLLVLLIGYLLLCIFDKKYPRLVLQR